MDPARRAATPRAWTWFAAAAAIVLADRLTKLAMLAWLAPGESRALTGFFNLVLAFNKGAAFSFLAGAPGWQTPLFVAFSLVASVVIAALILRRPGERVFCAGLALILGGALGNLYDRLAYGYVVDFLEFYIGPYHWPSFNVADSAISIGVVLLAIEITRNEAPSRT